MNITSITGYGLLIALIGGFFTIFIIVFKNFLKKNTDNTGKIFTKIDGIGMAVSNLEVKLAENYVCKADFKEHKEENSIAHKELRQDIYKRG